MDTKNDSTTAQGFERWHVALESGDKQAWLGCFAPGGGIVIANNGARFLGQDALEQFWQAMFGTGSREKISFEHLFIQGDRALLVATIHITATDGTTRDQLAGCAMTFDGDGRLVEQMIITH